jgi:hypothetical protein
MMVEAQSYYFVNAALAQELIPFLIKHYILYLCTYILIFVGLSNPFEKSNEQSSESPTPNYLKAP